MSKVSRSRTIFLAAAIYTMAALFITRLYFIQIVHGDDYQGKADRQYSRLITPPFDRGSIFFEYKDGKRIAAATLQMGYTLAINPSILGDSEEAYSSLAVEVPKLNRDDFMAKAEKRDDPYEEIAERLTQAQADALFALDIDGVILSKAKWRYFPGESIAAHVLGFVAFEGDKLGGRYGVERYYDDVLEREGNSVYNNFFAEVFGGIESVFSKPANLREGDVVLSIEPSVQAYLEIKLKEISDTWSSKGSGGIIMDPKTGAIYAMAAVPSFDPNNFAQSANNHVFSNPLIENVYEPGSIMKPISMAAGLDSGMVERSSRYTDHGTVVVDGVSIANFDGKGRGNVDMQEVLNQSLNTGMVEVVRRMGNEIFAEYMKNFGFGDETGVDLPGETRGLIGNLNSPRNIEYATAAFGQGIAVTPIGAVRALSALANGGLLVTPHVAKEVLSPLGVERSVFFEPTDRVISEETSKEITRMLVEVVDVALLEGTVTMPRYSIAAKTGTAQIARTEGGGYYDDRTLHNFFGYFPAFEPRFIVFLYTNEPQGVRYASRTLTIPFMDITKFLLNYYEVPPDR